MAASARDICDPDIYFNGTNATDTEKDQGLYITYNVLLVCITLTIMFSMGTSITVHDLKIILRRPVGPIVGIICQCIILPAVSFGYAVALNLAANLAIGMVLTCSCPGGSISNVIAFWAKADICLSITMTTVSTTLAIGFLPLNVWLYTQYWIKDSSEIPFLNMVITVIYMWAAAIIGYFVGRRWPKTVPYFTKIGSIVALLLILSAGVVQGKLYPELFDLTWEAWVGAITLPIIGFLIGYFLSWILCQGHPQRLAIGLETGVQNTALALTVIAVSFPSSYMSSCFSQFTILYTTFQVVLGIGSILFIWLYNMVRFRETPCAISREQLLARELELAGGVERGEPQLVLVTGETALSSSSSAENSTAEETEEGKAKDIILTEGIFDEEDTKVIIATGSEVTPTDGTTPTSDVNDDDANAILAT